MNITTLIEPRPVAGKAGDQIAAFVRPCTMRSMAAPAKTSRPPKLSPEGRNALRAMRRGIAAAAAKEYRRAGLTMAIWRNGRVALIRP